MKEVVITRPPYMNASEKRIADMHSVLNILNLLVGELGLIEVKDTEASDLAEAGKALDAKLKAYAQQIKEGGDVVNLLQEMRHSQDALVNHAKTALHVAATAAQKAQIQESIENLESIYSVFMRRLDEVHAHLEDPDAWVRMSPDALRGEIEDVFTAIAKNSKGRYGVQYNLARKKQEDYYLDLHVDVEPGGAHLWMPLRFLDVLRDLTANARKYTRPGGKVALAVYQDAKELDAVIEDSGCGIPSHELDKITEFGYRASNVRSFPTMGGGFGLTKAAWLVANWGGQLAISSVVDEGTTIRISIPNRKQNPA